MKQDRRGHCGVAGVSGLHVVVKGRTAEADVDCLFLRRLHRCTRLASYFLLSLFIDIEINRFKCDFIDLILVILNCNSFDFN